MNTRMMIARSSLALAVAGTAALPCAAAPGQDGPWLVRVRAVQLDSANKDSTGLGLTINNKVIPELDISYFFSPQISAELILTYPQKHTLSSNGTTIGTLKHLPPTLLGQYHFTGLGGFTPYIGAGLNFTNFSGVNMEPGFQGVTIKKNSFGLAAQIGVDIPLQDNISLNIDVKKVQIGTTVYSGGTEVGKLKVDPLLIGVGVGWRF